MLSQRAVGSYREVKIRRFLDDWAIWATGMLVALIVAVFTLFSWHVQFPLAAAIYIVGAVGILIHPRLGLYLMVFFAFVGEPNSIWWYPFNKNGSSAESILFVHGKLWASPYEGYIAFTAIGLLWQLARTRESLTLRSEFTYPAVIFSVAAMIGVVWGYLNGSVLSIAINQSRNIIIIPVLYLLFVNLVTDRRHIRILMWLIPLAIAVESILTLNYYYRYIDDVAREQISASGESVSTHSTSLHANIGLLLLAGSMLIGRTYRGLRSVLPFLLIPTLWAYYLSQRRSAVGALLIGLAILAVVLAKHRTGRFLLVVPPAAAVLLGYTLAFWNSTSSAAFPAQAIRSQISPTEGADSSSDLYRLIENVNLELTIASNPLLGTGFGRPFQIYIPMPDISGTFPLWNYLPHNSVLFIWVNAGLLGFFAMMYLWFKALRDGTALAFRSTNADDILVASVMTGTIAMIVVFTYLDISWDSQTVLLMTLSFGVISALRQIHDAEAQAKDPPESADARPERSDVRV